MNNDINRLLKIVSNNKKFIIIILMIFIAIGYIYSFNYKTPMYKSTATFVLVQNSEDSESITQKDITINQNLISTYSNIAKSNKVLKQVVENLNLNISESELSKQISVEAVKNTEVLKISVSNKDSELAAKIANELFNIFSKEVSTLYNISNVHIMDFAEKTEIPYNINHIKDIIIFVIAGIGVSTVLIGIIYLLDTTIKSEKDVETYTDLTVLSTIPLTNTKNESELITKNEPKSIIAESFKTLRTNIMYSIQNKKLKTILITSGYMGEGKSFISSNLAVTFAQSGKKVIFIDTDMRKGRLQKIFNIENRKGLSNLLSDINNEKNKININEYINKTEIPNLYVMTSGIVPPNPSELLASENMKKLLYTLNTVYDIVICDSAPCMLVTDSVILSKAVDTTVIVTSNKTTKITNLLETEKSIKLVGGNVSGVIINKMTENKKEYKNKYYYGHPEQLTETTKIENKVEEDLLKNKLYLKDIKIDKKIEEVQENNIQENSKNSIKNSKQIKENSNEIKELKSLYKVLMKNTLNILLNKEEKAESILDKIDNIKNSYRDDLEQIKNDQNRYEQELMELKNKQQENKKEITNLKRNQTINKKEIKGFKENIEELNKKQNNDEQEINLIKNKTTENKKEITKLKRNQTIAKKASEELKNRYKQEADNIQNEQVEYRKKLKEIDEKRNYEDEIKKLQEQFIEMQKNNQNQINNLLNKIEDLQKENRTKIDENNKFDNIKTQEKILEIQEYINSVEEKIDIPVKEEEIKETAKNIVPENTIIIKELKIQKAEPKKREENKYAIDYEKIKNRSKNKKVFAFFNKKENEKRNNYIVEENMEENNEIISQILSGTK